MQHIIFNPDYVLKPDDGKALIMAALVGRNSQKGITQTIAEVWNSDKANKIYHITQNDIPKDSLCHTCDKFDICRSVRQVCYRDIIRKYGTDKWYYPDVNCPYANK